MFIMLIMFIDIEIIGETQPFVQRKNVKNVGKSCSPRGNGLERIENVSQML